MAIPLERLHVPTRTEILCSYTTVMFCKAYEFVRRTVKLCLPHQSQLRKWYTKILADPGFTEPAFIALKEKVDSARKEGKQLLCSLVLDEVTIRKHVCCNGKKLQDR